MIQILSGTQPPGTSPILDNMFKDRKRVFVDLLRWDVPVVDGIFEKDQFDTSSAVYLVSATEDGEHLGSIRLLPTDRPHLLGSIFPHLCDGPVPTGPDLLEITRGCLSPRLRAVERLRVRNMLVTAAVHYALLHGVKGFTCVADSGWLSQILAIGWECKTLGEPRILKGLVTGALQIFITTATISQLKAAGAYVPASLEVAPTARVLAA